MLIGRQALALLWLRAAQWRSHRVAAIVRIASTLLGVLMLLYFGKLLEASEHPRFTASAYLSFSAVGIAGLSLVTGTTSATARWIREGQLTGTLESALSSPSPRTTSFALICLTSVPEALVNTTVGLLAASLFGADFALSYRLLVTLIACTWVAVPTAMLAAAVVALVKRGDIVTYAVSAAGLLLSGIYFPRDVLPEALQLAAHLVPITPVVDCLRATLTPHAGLVYWPSVGKLVAYGICIWPVAFGALAFVSKFGTIQGTLTKY